MSLLPVAQAQAGLLALAPPLPPCSLPLTQAAGRYLAEPLLALRDQPWADLSAMDGYAVRFGDMPGPWRLAGEMTAGAIPTAEPLTPGTAMRIFTGAPLPAEADTVIVQEDIELRDGSVHLIGDGPGALGRHIRARSSDFAQADLLLAAGTRLDPPALALAALAGHASLAVRPSPRVAILSTGSELVEPGAPCPPGSLPASNGIMLRAMLEHAGASVISESLVPDDLPRLTDALGAIRGADIIVTSGGASVGDHDLVRPALEAAGGSINFWRIAMRPGKPLIVGRLGEAILLGLPGNPISAMVTGALFLLPLVRHLAGSTAPLPQARTASLGSALPALRGERAEYLRAQVTGNVATPLAFQDSAAMRAAAQANALIIRTPGTPTAQAGDPVDILDWTALGLAH